MELEVHCFHKSFCAPLSKVNLRDVFLNDVLTSFCPDMLGLYFMTCSRTIF